MKHWVRSILNFFKPTENLVYRKIVNRFPKSEDVEIVKLECGHEIRLQHIQRISMPCLQCSNQDDLWEDEDPRHYAYRMGDKDV